MNPGVTDIPPASITCVWGPIMLRMSAELPAAMNLPSFTANASACGNTGSLVNTRPFTTTRSGLRLPVVGCA
jgi:hypothetical protein